VLTVILGLLVFSVLVIFHEAGHFLVARWMGIRVERFSIGFGPIVASRVWGGVQYAISAFPLGGYVKMGGDDPRERENLKPGDFFAAAWWRRVLVAFAGPGANFVLAVILSIALLWVGLHYPDAPNVVGGVKAGSAADSLGFAKGDRITAIDGVMVGSRQALMEAAGRRLDAEKKSGSETPLVFAVSRGDERTEIEVPRVRALNVLESLEFPIPAEVGQVMMGMPAYKSGLQVGDRILAIDGKPVANWSEMTEGILGNPGRRITLTIQRDGRTVQLPITPEPETTDGKTVGKIGIAPKTPETYVLRFGFLDGITQGTQGAVSVVGLTVQGIASLFSSPSKLSQISGPVAIIQASGDAAKAGWDRLLNLGLVLSVALMVFNLLPIPILDGGMVLLTVLEAVRRRPFGEKGLAIYQGVGMAVLGTILIFVLINDPLRILQRHNALGRIGDIAP
jgi:regulator of sigma E protease